MPEGDQPFKDEKTEEPTPKKIQKQKEKGNVFMSQDVATVIVVFCSAWVLFFLASWTFKHLYTVFTMSFEYSAWFRVDENNFHNFFLGVLLYVARYLAPLWFFFLLVGGFAYIAQTGWVVSWSKFKLDFNKLVKWDFKNLFPFDPKKLVDLLLNLSKVAVLGYVLFLTYRENLDKFLPYLDKPVIQLWFFFLHVLFMMVMKISMAMVLIAVIDFWYKRKKWNDDMKMTKWEVKEEKKMADGDPRIKSVLRSRRLALFRKIMMEAVPRADVIITNPTHYAVAIEYKEEIMEAPKVVAKGMGIIAQKIKDIGKDKGIPIVENKPLAQVLFKTTEVGEYIPFHLYQSVAEVLAYVYRLKNKAA